MSDPLPALDAAKERTFVWTGENLFEVRQWFWQNHGPFPDDWLETQGLTLFVMGNGEVRTYRPGDQIHWSHFTVASTQRSERQEKDHGGTSLTEGAGVSGLVPTPELPHDGVSGS